MRPIRLAPAPIGIGRDRPFAAPDPSRGLWLRPGLVRIWRQLVIGGSNKEIAQRLGLKSCTVRNSLTELYAVLELNPTHNRAYHSRTVATLWGMEILSKHPEAFKDQGRRKP